MSKTFLNFILQTTTSNKTPAGKQVTATDANNKSPVSANGVKSAAKQQQQQQNADVAQTADAKKKQAKANAAPAVNKQATTGKSISLRYLRE